MTVSSLARGSIITTKRSTRTQPVGKATPHYMCAAWSGEDCAAYFRDCDRDVSANYCIGMDGGIICNVPEDYRAWTTSSAWNDQRAITVEVANGPGGAFTTAAWNSLVALFADICRRYGLRMNYTGTRDGSLTCHDMFAATDCPGPWMKPRMGQLASEVNAILDGGKAPTAPSQEGGLIRLEVDGYWGCDTNMALQRALGTVEDGVISSQSNYNYGILGDSCRIGWEWVTPSRAAGSPCIRALQRKVGSEVDGICGPNTVRALQTYLGTVADGRLDAASSCVMEMQRRLVAGTF